MATSQGQSIGHTSTNVMNVEGADGANGPFRISVKEGNAKWKKSAAAGGASGVIGDGTLLDWQIHTAVNNTPFTGSTVSAGPGTYLRTATCADTTAGGPQNYFDVWQLNDMDTEPSDIPNGTTPAVGNGPTPITGNIDISGLAAGQFYVLNGSFSGSARVNLTMTGPGKSPIVMPEYVAPNPGSTNKMYMMEFTFNNPNGEYTNIVWSSNNGQNNTGRRRWGGVFLDGTLYVDTTEPIWEASFPSVAPVSDTLFFVNGQINESGTVHYVVLPDGATPPSPAQVKAGTDASDTPVALSGNFAVEGFVAGSEIVSGLAASTAYDVYVVAEDVRGPNLQASPVLIEVTTTAPDNTPPSWTATYPQVNRTPASVTGIANLDEAGTAYFVALPSGATAPTSAQVKAGTDAADSPAAAATIAGLLAGIDGSVNIGGLTVGVTYDVYFVAQDLAGNLQASPQLVSSAPAAAVDQFASGGFTWGTDSKWSSVSGGPYTGPWADGNNAVFEGTGGTIPVNAGTVVNDITFPNGYTLLGGPMILAGTLQPTITVTTGVSQLGNSLGGTQGFRKTGSGILRMTGTNTITGGIVIDGGWLGDNLGPAGTASLNNNDITANAGAVGITFGGGTVTDGSITINDTTLGISNNNSSITINGPVTGNGGIALPKTGNGQNLVFLISTSNTFSGGVNYTSDNNVDLNVNSFVDAETASENVNIRLGVGNPASNRRHRFALHSGATSPLTLTNRQFEITSANNFSAQIHNYSEQAFTIASDLLVSGTGPKSLELGGTGTGASTFAGDIADGSGTLSLTKAGTSNWTLSGTNTYTGNTFVNAGTLTLLGGSQASPITVNNNATLGFTVGSPTTSSATVTLNTGHKIAVTGTPNGTSDYLLMTAASITGTPVVDPPVIGYSLEVQGSGTQLVLVADAPTATLVIDLGAGTAIEGGQFIGSGPTNLPLPSLPVGSILRSVTYDNVTLTASDNGSDGNYTADLAVLLDPTPGTPGGDFLLGITSNGANQNFGGLGQTLRWRGGNNGVGTALTESKTYRDWTAAGNIDLATTGLFLGNAYQGQGWVSPQGGTWTGTITLRYDLVSSGSPYATWASTNAPTGNPDDDFDGDGVINVVEFVLGGDKDSNDLGKLPKVGTTPAGDMTFTFVRAQSSIDALVTASIEVGTDLATWPAEYLVPGTPTAGPPVAVVDNGNGTETVTLTVPQAPDAKKFARLKVGVATP